MTEPYVLYGARSSGSIPVEAAMTLLGLTYTLVDGQTWRDAAAAERVRTVNPMGQIPTLVLPGGEVLTESAAILIWLADFHPEARLAPTLASPRRTAFLRWMHFIAASIYSLAWMRDDPGRVGLHGEAAKLLWSRTEARRLECWRVMDAQVAPAPYVLGPELGVLDLYLTAVTRWPPRRRRFYEAAPKLAAVARLVDAEPRLADFWAERAPFKEGWEG